MPSRGPDRIPTRRSPRERRRGRRGSRAGGASVPKYRHLDARSPPTTVPAMLRALAVVLGVAPALVAAAGAVGPGTPGPGTRLAGCPVFPRDNAWNRDVSRAPV